MKTTEVNRRTHRFVIGLLGVSTGLLSAGCSALPDVEDELAATAESSTSRHSAGAVSLASHEEEKRVSNPRAREIRFDGQELVLGGGECQSLPVDVLRELTTDLRERGRHRSAAETVRLHQRTATRWLVESFAETDGTHIRFVASVLDGEAGTAIYTDLCDIAAADPKAARAFTEARRGCLGALADGSTDKRPFDTLRASVAAID
ncbi:MAG: hypothetical protein AAF907_17635, partial [Planctomycetota bacterium]